MNRPSKDYMFVPAVPAERTGIHDSMIFFWSAMVQECCHAKLCK